MPRKAGYLASLFTAPPLIFRFQFNPESLTEKKTYQYNPAAAGKWEKVQGKFLSAASNLWTDISETLPAKYLMNVEPLRGSKGEPRVLSLEFVLDASTPGPLDQDDHHGGSIEPDLAVLRAFMNPAITYASVSGFRAAEATACHSGRFQPPPCSLSYGGLSLECVMTDLNIKLTSFFDDGKPRRAEVGVTLKEQSASMSAVADWTTRNYQIIKGYVRKDILNDVLAITPVVGLFR